MKSLLLWLAMPLLSDCQTLEESWFIKKDVNKAIIENAKYQDVDTTNAATHYVIGKWNVYVNYIKDELEHINYILDRGNVSIDIYLLFDGSNWYARSEVNWKVVDWYDEIEYIQSYLPCKIVKI